MRQLSSATLSLAALLISAAGSSAATVTNDVEFTRRGDTRLLLDASIPDGPGPFPTVIIVHGGGFMRGNKTTYVTPIFQPLTAGKFAWFTINYRLVPEAHLPEMLDDVVSALQWVHQHAREYKVDRKKVALLGESAGAYLIERVAMLETENAPVAAAVSFYGPNDMVLQANAKGLSEGLRGLTGVQELNADGEANLRAISPYYLVRNGLPPFLLLHGTVDEQVSYDQSPRFCEELIAKGNQCELFPVPDGRHGMGAWEQHPDQQAYKAKVVKWLHEKLR